MALEIYPSDGTQILFGADEILAGAETSDSEMLSKLNLIGNSTEGIDFSNLNLLSGRASGEEPAPMTISMDNVLDVNSGAMDQLLANLADSTSDQGLMESPVMPALVAQQEISSSYVDYAHTLASILDVLQTDNYQIV